MVVFLVLDIYHPEIFRITFRPFGRAWNYDVLHLKTQENLFESLPPKKFILLLLPSIFFQLDDI